MSEKRDMSGAIFKAKANENPKWPQYEGSCVIGGEQFWISAWVKDGKSGKFFSLAFKPKDKRSVPPPARNETADDSIPF